MNTNDTIEFFARPNIWDRQKSGITLNNTNVTECMFELASIIGRKGGASVWADNTFVNEVETIIGMVEGMYGVKVNATMDSKLWAINFRVGE